MSQEIVDHIIKPGDRVRVSRNTDEGLAPGSRRRRLLPGDVVTVKRVEWSTFWRRHEVVYDVDRHLENYVPADDVVRLEGQP